MTCSSKSVSIYKDSIAETALPWHQSGAGNIKHHHSPEAAYNLGAGGDQIGREQLKRYVFALCYISKSIKALKGQRWGGSMDLEEEASRRNWEYCPAFMNKKEILPFTTTWTKLEWTPLSEISEIEKKLLHDLTHAESKKAELKETD